MRLSTYIRQNRNLIVDEWNAFTRMLKPSANLSDLELADHIDDILTFIADNIEAAQTPEEQYEKSRGQQPERNGGTATAAQTHATLRHDIGFDIVELVSEYRALRATIYRLWDRATNTEFLYDRFDLERFNEALDQAIAESVLRFSQDVEKEKFLLLGVLGHDIRNPVAAIQMAASLIPQMGDTSRRQHELLAQIEISAARVQHIVTDLLDLARSSTVGQTIPMRRKRCSMSDLCRHILGEARIRHPDCTFVPMVPDNIEGWWDEVRLGQVLANLMSNAVQYGTKGGPVVVTLIDAGDEVAFSVHNEGHPIPAIHLDMIFKSFTRLPVASAGDGSASNLGLGLFISREIVVAHSGDIEVTSNEYDGTTFRVRLPKFAVDFA